MILLIGFSITYLSCNFYIPPPEPIKKTEIYGRYVANFGDGVEYIDLNPDTTYMHYTKLGNGEEFYNKGIWSLSAEEYQIIPEATEEYKGKGTFEAIGKCRQYSLTFYEFIRRYPTPTIYPTPEDTIVNAEPHTWATCLFKKGGKIIIKYFPVDRNFYIKQ